MSLILMPLAVRRAAEHQRAREQEACQEEEEAHHPGFGRSSINLSDHDGAKRRTFL